MGEYSLHTLDEKYMITMKKKKNTICDGSPPWGIGLRKESPACVALENVCETPLWSTKN